MPWLFGTSLALVAPKAHAWGDEGHRVIGELAFRFLSARAKSRVQEALTEPGYESLAEAATWPDRYARRHPEYDAMKPFHYVNVEPTAAHYDHERDCPNGCVVTALAQFSELLAEPELSLSERRRCIYWVAHLMGDIHQPLHIAHPDHKGGNATLLPFFEAKDKRSAHWIWDFGLLERRPVTPPPTRDGIATDQDQPAFRALADELAAELTPAKRRAFQHTTAPARLADEGLRIARRYAFLKPSDRVDTAYESSRFPVVKEQLQKAGARLAAVLERAFGGAEG
jgi:hypothetical protein